MSEQMNALAAQMKIVNDSFAAAMPQVLDAFMKTPEARQIGQALDAFYPGWRNRS